MKKSTFIILFIFFVAANLYSQESYIKNRWNIKLAYAHYQTNISISETGAIIGHETTGNYQVEANYGILNFLETGVYLGYSSWSIDKSFYTYGGNINMHILPFFIQAEAFRFDAYLTGKVGGNVSERAYGTYNPYTSEYTNTGSYNYTKREYGMGLGAAFYLFKRLGVFAEYSLGEYFFDDNKKFRAGLSFKFKK